MDFFESNSNQSFIDLITGDDAYIDKTEQIVELYKDHDVFELLLRPFGFGKTVLLDTIYHMFAHPDEPLLQNLSYKSYDIKLPEHLIIKLDFGSKPFKTPDDLKEYLFGFYRTKTFEMGIDNHCLKSANIYCLTTTFIEELTKASRTGKIIILIDNYDTPIIDSLFKSNLQELNCALFEFYKALEDCEIFIDWCLITGESKFYFCYENCEGLNYVNDLTNSERSTTVCGFTKGEMKKYYLDFIQDEADSAEQTVEEFLGKLNDWYGNYRFTTHNIKLMRPASIKSFLSLRDQNQYKLFYPYEHIQKFLPKLLKSNGRVHEKLLTPNNCDYDFCEYSSLKNVKMFALLSQLGIYSFSHIDIQISEAMQLYTYYSALTNREMRDIYSMALTEANNIKDL